MAKRKNLTPSQKRKLEHVIVEGLEERDFAGQAELEPSGLLGKYRLYVICDDFEELLEAERQDTLRQILQEKWSRENQLRLTLILGLTKNEAAGSWN